MKKQYEDDPLGKTANKEIWDIEAFICQAG
jgi:hypothetical protein